MGVTRWSSVGLLLFLLASAAQGQEKRPPLADLVSFLDSRSPQARLAAVQMIGELGSAGKGAAAKLGDIVRDDFTPVIAEQAALTLAKIGPGAVDELVRCLKDARPEVRLRALRALVLIGPDGGRAAPVLAELLQERDLVVRSLALQSLASMGPHAGPAVKALCRNLRDPSPVMRQLTCGALKGLGTDAVPELTKHLDLGDVQERMLVIDALCEIAREFKDAVPPLLQTLKDPDPRIRAKSAQALGSLQSRAESALEPLMPLILDQNIEVQQHAYAAVLLIGAKDKTKLLRALAEHQGKGQWAIPFFLSQYGPHARDAVAPLTKIVANPTDPNRLGAIIALGQIGNDAKEALPVLTSAMKDPAPSIRGAAYMAACKVAKTPEENWYRQLAQTTQMAESFRQMHRDRKKKAHAEFLYTNGATVWQPINWSAMTDPRVQAEYNKLVELHIMLSTTTTRMSIPHQEKLPKAIADALDRERVAMAELRCEVAQAILELPPEAIPALIRGINMTVIMNLGFT